MGLPARALGVLLDGLSPPRTVPAMTDIPTYTCAELGDLLDRLLAGSTADGPDVLTFILRESMPSTAPRLARA